jgi:uncharacterized protein
MSSLKKYLFIFLVIIIFIAIPGCKRKKTYTIATSSPEMPYHKVGTLIADLLESKGERTVNILEGDKLGSLTNSKKLLAGEVDFAIAQNDTQLKVDEQGNAIPMKTNLQTVMPLYPEILFIIYPKTVAPKSISELVIGRRIGVGPKDSWTAQFLINFLKIHNITKEQYTLVYTSWNKNVVSDKIDVSVTTGGYNAVNVDKMMRSGKYEMYSLDNPILLGKGSAAEGFCLNYPEAKPFIVPRHTFGSEPRKPVLTLAVDAVLLCREEIDKYEIYNMVKQIYTHKQDLARKNPLLEFMYENYNRNRLNYPLHEGAIMYLERSAPSFFTRYSKVIKTLISTLATLIGLLSGLLSWKKSKKQSLIDLYCKDAIAIDKEIEAFEKQDIPAETLREKRLQALKQLKYMKREAFRLLTNKKLSANQNFTIFLKLVDDFIDELEAVL